MDNASRCPTTPPAPAATKKKGYINMEGRKKSERGSVPERAARKSARRLLGPVSPRILKYPLKKDSPPLTKTTVSGSDRSLSLSIVVYRVI